MARIAMLLTASEPSSVPALDLTPAYTWWQHVNDYPPWQDRIFYALASLYGLVATLALVQLIRIQCRVPEYGWTTQKVFHLLNFLVNGVRCLVFIFYRNVESLQPEIARHILLDLPSLAFFTTYALLVLFWAEIYYQARAVSTDELKPSFITINAVVYAIQIILWLILWWKPVHAMVILSKIFFAGVSLFAALGFLLFGGSDLHGFLFLIQVGYVTTICFLCFLVRCIMMCFDAFDKNADLDVLAHPILNFIYYLLVEILPSALVLFILRKLPPKRGITQYHPIQ
ncbi:hypothetical protein PIB30_007382 [Stylosanthes scabra]|uniref:THH1/TOM1/TOM3 domain-containing protein n=1 Tax=Stylosanthes scabra TaxID=79078 RepID=A0ABU6Z493_9FABA|nr:hypothetical protein [Stylosanthes scabra]